MKCIRIAEFGGPNVLQFVKNSEIPKAVGKQVLINVKFAGVNPLDTYIRSGSHSIKPSLPYTPGIDGAGIIKDVGEKVDTFKEGDRVWFGCASTGSYAEFCLCNEDRVKLLPDNMSFDQGSMIGTPYLTSYRALYEKANMKSGETVMIHGATGGMKCIRIAEFGGPNVLQFVKNSEIPKAVGQQVLINVKFAGVNPLDTYIRSGSHSIKPSLPYTPGIDGAGIIKDVGEKVDTFKEGDRVWFECASTGSYAEFCLCNEDRVKLLPDNMSFDQGSMIGTPYLTSYRALYEKANMKSGETVMIHGATGGCGLAAVELCKMAGANIIATAGSKEGEEILRSKLNVDKVYNHKCPGYMDLIASQEGRIDIIFEMLANVNLENDMKIIGKNGRIVVIGCRGSIEVNPRHLMAKEASIVGCALTSGDNSEGRAYIQEKMASGMIEPILWKVVSLEKAHEAHAEIIENSGSKGQIVLKVD